MKKYEFKLAIESDRRPLVSIENFVIHPGRIHFLFGESGIGKTLLSQAIYGLLDPDELRISINGLTYREYLRSSFVQVIRPNSFFVFQEPSSHLNPMLTLKTQIREGALSRASNEGEIIQSIWPEDRDAGAGKLLNIYPKPYRPSGGEKQRFLLTMAFKKISLLQNGQDNLFVFDEPTGNLDDALRNRVLNLLLDYYRKKAFTVLFITHDYSLISELHDHYADLGGSIRLYEIIRKTPPEVRQKAFSAAVYLKWLKKLSPGPVDKKKPKTVLLLQGGFRAIGKEFHFYRNAELKKKTTLTLRCGEFVYLKAASGGGKTTVAKIILGMLSAQNLKMNCCGHKIDSATSGAYWRKHLWGRRAAMVFQHADEALDRQSTVLQAFRGLPIKAENFRERIIHALQNIFEEKIDRKFLDKKIAFLSGGQKQRLNILRALILDTDLVILDEPLNGLDFASIDKVLYLLEEKRKQGAAVLLISHNEEIFSRLVPEQNVYYLKTY